MIKLLDDTIYSKDKYIRNKTLTSTYFLHSYSVIP